MDIYTISCHFHNFHNFIEIVEIVEIVENVEVFTILIKERHNRIRCCCSSYRENMIQRKTLLRRHAAYAGPSFPQVSTISDHFHNFHNFHNFTLRSWKLWKLWKLWKITVISLRGPVWSMDAGHCVPAAFRNSDSE